MSVLQPPRANYRISVTCLMTGVETPQSICFTLIDFPFMNC